MRLQREHWRSWLIGNPRVSVDMRGPSAPVADLSNGFFWNNRHDSFSLG